MQSDLSLTHLPGHGASYLDAARKQFLFDLSMEQARLDEGDFAEFGVFRGGSAVILGGVLRRTQSRRRLHLFDSWQGIPQPGIIDTRRLKKGDLSAAKNLALKLLTECGLIPFCDFYDGFFSETLYRLTSPISFAHVDCDLYEGAKHCLQRLFPLMTAHGKIVVDDYCKRFPGVMKAVEESLPRGWAVRVLGGERDQSALIERLPVRKSGNHKIAGIMSVKNYNDDCAAFASLKELSDITIVLDHNSEAPFPYRHVCDEYLVLKNHAPWNDIGNLSLLMHRAFINECMWVVRMDDDLIFSDGFQWKQDVLDLIESLEREQADAGVFTLRDLWESKSHYRDDGIWGKKVFVPLMKNWFFYENITLPKPQVRLHRPIYPANLKQRTFGCPHIVYHTGCITEQQRICRVEKYRKEDPKNRWQADYSYMLNKDNLEISAVSESDARILERKLGITLPVGKQTF